MLQKVKGGTVDCAVLAAADVERLNKQEFVSELLTNQVCVPAAGQGALAVLIRSSEDQFRDVVQNINDPATHAMLRAQWWVLEHLGVDSSRAGRRVGEHRGQGHRARSHGGLP